MKTPEQFYREAATKLGLDLKVVQIANRYYWKHGIRKNLSSLEHRSVFIKNIGTITTSRYKLYKSIAHHIQYLRNLRISTKYGPERREEIRVKIFNNLKKMLIRRNELAWELYKKEENERINGMVKADTSGITEH